MKKSIFLLFTCLLLVALVLPACAAPKEKNVVKIGVIGPMKFVQGEHHWWGAEMARDEINAAGGVTIGGEKYMIELIQADSNEILSVTDAAAAMERLITVDKANFVIGGFRTEAVFAMQEVAMDYKTIFLNCGAATLELNTPVLENYDRYKYYFRATPFCNVHLVSNTLMEVGMAGAIIKQQTGLQRKLRVAICAEGAQWADAMVAAMNALIPAKLGMEVSGTWRPSPTATELTAEMTAIEKANTDIIMPIISGPLGIPYARSWGELKVPAASVGINVESQKDGFWDATGGFGNYETTLNSYAEGSSQSPLTIPFVEAFKAKTGQTPTYTAGTYDSIFSLVEAIERAGTLDADAVVAELEKTDKPNTGAPRFVYTGMDAPLKNPHDVTYGPGFTTGIVTQWQDGKMVAVWPKKEYGTGDWANLEYPGTVLWKAPPRVIEKLKAEAAKEPPPAAPPKEEPKEVGAPSFKAKTYTNENYGFSVQYPAKWEARPENVTGAVVASFGEPAFIPGISLAVYDVGEGSAVERMVAILQQDGNKNIKVVSESEGALADGTPAVEGKVTYTSATGRDLACYYILAQKGGKWVRAIVWTIDMYEPYDEAKFSEIAHTLQFKK